MGARLCSGGQAAWVPFLSLPSSVTLGKAAGLCASVPPLEHGCQGTPTFKAISHPCWGLRELVQAEH